MFFDEIVISLGGGGYLDSEGPRSLRALAKRFRDLGRIDGVRLKGSGPVYRDPTYRIGGRDVVKVTVLRKRR